AVPRRAEPPQRPAPPLTADVLEAQRVRRGMSTRVPMTRTAGLWIASVLFAVVLLLLLIFILQNGQRAEISFFGAHAHPPVGVALLLAAVFGFLLVALRLPPRILQLRVLARPLAAAPAPSPHPPPH